MKSGGGKRKGGAFERKICKELSLWFSNGENHNIFWRSITSGGKATIHREKGEILKYSSGDIGLLDPIGKPFLDRFYVELKSGYPEAANLTNLFYNKNHLILKWYEKAESESQNNQCVMIIYKPPQKSNPLIVLPNYYFLHDEHMMKSNRYMVFDDELFIVSYHEFFKWFKPEMCEIEW